MINIPAKEICDSISVISNRMKIKVQLVLAKEATPRPQRSSPNLSVNKLTSIPPEMISKQQTHYDGFSESRNS